MIVQTKDESSHHHEKKETTMKTKMTVVNGLEADNPKLVVEVIATDLESL